MRFVKRRQSHNIVDPFEDTESLGGGQDGGGSNPVSQHRRSVRGY